MRKRRVAGRIYGTKYSWKGYKDRNRHKNRIKRSGQAPFIIIIIIIIYPLTKRVVRAPQMILKPVSPIFPCSPLPSGTWRTPGLSIPWCCLPTSSSVFYFFIASVQSFFIFFIFFIYLFFVVVNLVLINRRNGPQYRHVLALSVCFFFF